jgi:predicted nucleic acid-binding protein
VKKPSSIVIDSSVYLSVLNEQETHHATSRKFWDRVTNSSSKYSIIFPRLVYIEIGNRLFNRVHRYDELFETQQRILTAPNSRISELDESIWLTAEMIQYHCHLKTSDMLVAATAYETASTLVSWDQQLLKEANKVVPVATPGEFN